MNITVTDQENCKKQLKLEIPVEAVNAAIDKAATVYARQVSIPGFRPGHAPKSVVKTRFRKELRDEAVSQLLPESVQQAITENDLKVLGEPAMNEFNFGDDGSINATITVSVRPEFELPDYKGLPLTKRVYKIRDEDIEERLQRLREMHAEMAPVEDRDAQDGDTLSVTLIGRFEAKANGADEGEAPDAAEADPAQPDAAVDAKAEEALDAGKADEVIEEDVEITLGAKGVLKEFTEALTGARSGDFREFSVEYPREYKPERFAGRKVNYSANVTAVRVKELPAIDDDFAHSVDEEFQTAADLRANIREQLEHAGNHRTEEELREAALEALLKPHQFAVPEFLLESQLNVRFQSLLNSLYRSGINPEQMQLDWANIRQTQRDRAERDVRGLFVLDRIGEAENLEVSDEEINQEIEGIAASRGESVAATKARLTKEHRLDSIKEQVRHQKALDLVIASADLKTEEVEGLRPESAGSDQPAEPRGDAPAEGEDLADSISE